MAGLYIHFPFCRQACSYCDFHFSTNLTLLQAMVDAIRREMDMRRDELEGQRLTSIYFGGGTPSLLHPDHIRAIIDQASAMFGVEHGAEITLEANPDDITGQSLDQWLNAGANRLSIGVQSFNDDELKWMNRAHHARDSVEAVELSRRAGFDNLTIDLIYGSKFQTLESWDNTLKRAVDLGSDHISSYNLTVEKNTRLGREVQKGMEPDVDDDLSAAEFTLMKKILKEAGFVHYEISNFAKPGRMAVHNSNYWKGEHYMGLGPSAHSFNGAIRRWNVNNNHLYIKGIQNGEPAFEQEWLGLKEQYNEYVMTGLRTMWGCSEKVIRSKWGDTTLQHFKNQIRFHSGLFDEKDGNYVLNEKGQLMADRIAASLFL